MNPIGSIDIVAKFLVIRINAVYSPHERPACARIRCARREAFNPLGLLGFEGAQHRQTLRPSIDRIRSKALRPFGLQ